MHVIALSGDECTSVRLVIEEESLCSDVLRCVVTSLRTTSNGRLSPSIVCVLKNESDGVVSSLSSCNDDTLNTNTTLSHVIHVFGGVEGQNSQEPLFVICPGVPDLSPV